MKQKLLSLAVATASLLTVGAASATMAPTVTANFSEVSNHSYYIQYEVTTNSNDAWYVAISGNYFKDVEGGNAKLGLEMLSGYTIDPLDNFRYAEGVALDRGGVQSGACGPLCGVDNLLSYFGDDDVLRVWYATNGQNRSVLASNETGYFSSYYYDKSIDKASNLTLFGAPGTGSPPPVLFTTITTAVPEPETYAMMLAGLGVLGFMGKRRKAG